MHNHYNICKQVQLSCLKRQKIEANTNHDKLPCFFSQILDPQGFLNKHHNTEDIYILSEYLRVLIGW